jgi:hypothetical protein
MASVSVPVSAEVAPKLVPDVAPHVGARLGAKPGARQHGADRVDARRLAAARLADDQPFADAVPYASGRGARRREMDHAAEHLGERQLRQQEAAGIDALERRLVGGRGGKEPPRDAVHRRQHDGVGADQRRHRRRRGGERRRLQGDHDQLVDTEARGVVAHRDRHGDRGSRAVELQAAGAHARQRLAARERRHRVVCTCEAGGDEPADRTQTDDCDLHRASRRETLQIGTKLRAPALARARPSGKIARSFVFMACPSLLQCRP